MCCLIWFESQRRTTVPGKENFCRRWEASVTKCGIIREDDREKKGSKIGHESKWNGKITVIEGIRHEVAPYALSTGITKTHSRSRAIAPSNYSSLKCTSGAVDQKSRVHYGDRREIFRAESSLRIRLFASTVSSNAAVHQPHHGEQSARY